MRWIAGLLFSLLLATTGAAQEPPATDTAKVQQLLRLLQDPEVKTWLETTTPEATVRSAGPSPILTSWEASTRSRIDRIMNAIPNIPSELAAAASRTRRNAIDNGYAPVLAIFAILAGAGFLGEKAFFRWRPGAGGATSRLLGLCVFSILVAVMFFAVDWPPLPRLVLLAYLVALVVWRGTVVAVDVLVASARQRPRLRLISAILILACAFALLGPSLAVDPSVTEAISCCFSLVVLALAVEFLWSATDRTTRSKVAFSTYLALLWALWLIGLAGMFWLGIYALVLPALLKAVGTAAEGFSGSGKGMRSVLLVRGSRAIVVVLAMAWLALIWRFNPNSLARVDPAIAAISYGLLKSVVLVLIADIVWHLARSWIDTTLEQSQEATSSSAEAARAGRMRTLLPILRNVLAVVVVVMTGLIVLAELGVKIGPLIAGAGIFGVALGFGSQTLVKDVIGGVFYMLDDAFRIGEYIQAKNYKGTVEGFSLRSVRLRHHRGPVFTVPFGELGAVENMSRDWGVVKFRISVVYETDVEKARKLTKKIGSTLMEDPELGPLFIEPLKMKGVEEFGDYGIVLSFGMMLRPSPMQSFVRRRANLLLREAFMSNGIEFATPSVQVGSDDKAATAAAATAIRASQAEIVATKEN